MADNLPISFPIPTENTTTSLSFSEFATNTGIVNLYPVAAKGGNFLSSVASSGHAGNEDSPITNIATNGNIKTAGSDADVDFDTTFNSPLTLKGKALINFTAVMRRISGGSASIASTYTATLIHYDGSSETILGSASSFTITETLNNGESAFQEASLAITIPKTDFKIGDILRLSLKATNNNSNWDSWILIDGLNRSITLGNFTSVFSDCTVRIPIKYQT